MGANARSTVGTVTDASAMLRVLWSRIGTPHVGSPKAFAFNVPSVRGAGQITIEKGDDKTGRRPISADPLRGAPWARGRRGAAARASMT